MAFDFPASPTIGQISNGYVYDGMGWKGGPVPAAGQPTETFVNLGGSTEQIVTVPSWAKGVTVEGMAFPATTSSFAAMQVSMDGTTFKNGAADYQLAGGPYHNVTGGYGTQGAVATAWIYLGYNKTNLNVPHQFRCDMNLDVPVGPNQIVSYHTQMQAYDNTTFPYNMEWTGYLNVAVSPGRVQKLRIYQYGGGVWPVGSWAKFRWHGDSLSIPQSNAIPDSPQDGGEYVRVNGVWRLKSNSYAPTITPLNIAVPAGARDMRLHSVTYASVSAAINMRASIDGTNYLVGASDYAWAGNMLYSGSAAMTKWDNGLSSAVNLTQTTDALANPLVFDLSMNVARITNAISFAGMYRSMGYHTSAGAHMTEYSIGFWLNGASWTSALTLKGIQLYLSAGTFVAGSAIDVEWVY